MKTIVTTRLRWLLWLMVLSVFVGVWMYPISTKYTRASGVVLFVYVWFGLLALVWKNRTLRFTSLTITALTVIFLLLPARTRHDETELRSSYVAGLLRYEGTHYFWGGESPKGIDCSGLIRRGLVDSLFLRGVRTLDAGLVRHALWLWWNDCTARELGAGHGMTKPLLETPSINALDPAKISPGDIAVTADGLHIMAYLGGNRWIEADPNVQRVLTVTVPSKDNPWFGQPMKVMRWNILRQ
jgi:hypothetical protein